MEWPILLPSITAATTGRHEVGARSRPHWCAPSSDPYNVFSYHSTDQRLDVLHDSRLSGVVIRSQTINQMRKRAWGIETPPDVIADIIQAEIAAAFDAHNQNFAVHLRRKHARASGN